MIAYEEWLKKPCWSRREILYLVSEVDPALIPGGVIVDLDEGTVSSAPPDKRIFQLANSEKTKVVADLLDRAIRAGELLPSKAGEDCFRPHVALQYLKKHRCPMPEAISKWVANAIEQQNFGHQAEHRGEIGPPNENVRRKVPDISKAIMRKTQTQAVHAEWQNEYRKLKRKHPDKSNVWISHQIAKLPTGKAHKAETIRKNMK